MAYTPVLKATGGRFRINRPIFEEGFRHGRGLGKKGIVKDPETGKRYWITGKSCSLKCECDAWAIEIPNQLPKDLHDAIYNVVEYLKETNDEDMGAPEGEGILDYVRTIEELMRGLERAN